MASDIVRVASVQCDVVFGDPQANADRVIERIERLAERRVSLAVFPEAVLTGYCVESCEDAAGIAVSLDQPQACLEQIHRSAERLGIVVVAGAATSSGGAVRNSALLFEPGCPMRAYHKSHLPILGLDRYVVAGDELPVFDTHAGKLGILVCFDLRPPEAARVLALQGAEIIVVPTNWPEGALVSADILAVARAAENRVFVVSSNRVGVENGFRFIGRSKIVDPTGRVLQSAGDGEEVLIADLDLAMARQKRTVVLPGRYETEVLASRRPELYSALVQAKNEHFGT